MENSMGKVQNIQGGRVALVNLAPRSGHQEVEGALG